MTQWRRIAGEAVRRFGRGDARLLVACVLVVVVVVVVVVIVATG